MYHLEERIAKILKTLKALSVLERFPAENIEIRPCGYKTDDTPPSDGWTAFSENDLWGGEKDRHAWFRFDVKLPDGRLGKETELVISTGYTDWDEFNPQFLCYIDGKMRQGLDKNHASVRIAPADKHIDIYAYTGYDAYVFYEAPDAEKRFRFSAEFVLTDTETKGLFYDMQVPFTVLSYTDPESREYAHTLDILNDCVNLLDFRAPHSKSYFQSVKNARTYMRENYYRKNAAADLPSLTCIGQTHIDTAWLWPMRQTREKVQRSFSTALELMRRYPEYKFFASQPKQYQMLKEDAPEVYAELKERVLEGRWEAEGGMWVEADCNLIGGESFIRQILHGKTFFKKEFGIDSKVLWLPDVFGYTASMPQMLRGCGIDTFVTSKISWNDTNRMPYDLFFWKGIDGTEILSFFITSQEKTRGGTVNYSVYNAPADAPNAAGTYARFGQKNITDDVMMLYGYGDGGGGPTDEHLENLRRMEQGVINCPRTRIGRVGEYFDSLHKKADGSKKLPEWSGELYLEFHRGTYTSQAKNKRNNRKSEMGLRNAEMLSVLSRCLTGREYPKSELWNLWESVLTNQFHDIIPGSSVKEVYETTDREYAEVFKGISAIENKAFGALSSRVKTEGGYFVFNPNGARAYDVIKENGEYISLKNIPAAGYAVVRRADSGRLLAGDSRRLENEWFIVEFDEKMRISRLYDKRCEREVLREGEVGNKLVAYEDLPLEYDAWELRDYHKEKSWEIEDVQCVKYKNAGDRAEITVLRRFENSTVEQTISLYRDLPRIDFDTRADWQTEHIVLKAEFPVSVHSARATYDIQFGAVERPATLNNSWEAAKFEVCAHKYADYSDYGYGVAILNDCKYGHDIHDGVIRLTLLKCPTYPNPDADKGEHLFSYSLMPHEGDYRAAGVIREAYAFNAPVTAVKIGKQDGTLPQRFSLVAADVPSVVIDTVKFAEDGTGVIVRCFEAFNAYATVNFRLGVKCKKVLLCDHMENEKGEISGATESFCRKFRPYEICTFKIVL